MLFVTGTINLFTCFNWHSSACELVISGTAQFVTAMDACNLHNSTCADCNLANYIGCNYNILVPTVPLSLCDSYNWYGSVCVPAVTTTSRCMCYL